MCIRDRPPTKTSGIRLGTAALTTRGMKEDDMRQIARWIDTVIRNLGEEKVIERVRNEVHGMCDRYPLYPEWREKAHKLLKGQEG